MRIITILLLALISVSFNRDEVPLSWATTCESCYVTSANLLDAVNNGVFVAKTTVPNTHNYLTRSQANALVELDPELNGNHYVLKNQMQPKGPVPHGYTFALNIYTTNTSDAADEDIEMELSNLDGGEIYEMDVSPPFFVENWEDNGIEGYYHTLVLNVTNNSNYDINVHIYIDPITGDSHSVNINFTVFAHSSDGRTFTFPFTPTLGSPRTLRFNISEGG